MADVWQATHTPACASVWTLLLALSAVEPWDEGSLEMPLGT